MIKKTKEEAAISRLTSSNKYQTDNRVFVAKKAKLRQEAINKKAELFDYVIKESLIPSKNFTSVLLNGMNSIDQLSKLMSEAKEENKKYKEELSNLNKKYN